MGKDVTAGRRPPRTRLPDTVGADPQAPTSRRGLAHKARADKQQRWRELYRCLEAHLLRVGWEDLHKAAASGGDPRTAEEEAVHLQATIAAWAPRLQTKRYRATLVRRCSLPKANGNARPLGPGL